MAGKKPGIIITFVDGPQNPKIEFVNWEPGISLGAIERMTQLLMREAMREQAKLANARHRLDELPARTTMGAMGEEAARG